ncbi:MAG: MraY family glycosyltransferase [candidate division Zixibacteria bacterium]|nr:MraY family glycosyltransferase [candidate division Zixibacteria bacterium]
MTFELPLITFLVGCLLGFVLIPLLIRLGHRWKLLDIPGRHKRHQLPTPILGGVGLFVALWISVLAASFLYPDMVNIPSGSLWSILLGSVVIFLVGLIDDFRPLPAWVKLVAQTLVAGILIFGGFSIDPVSIPFVGSVHSGLFAPMITIIWVVALTNAVNLLDGLDGLAAGVSLIGAVTMIIIGVLYQVGSTVTIAAALSGYLIVFLRYNRYPARIFLGDSGSMQIGYYFAVISLLVPLKSYTAAALYMPLLALGVPLLETVSSIIRRLASGKNPMQADRRHIFHYLALAGLGPRRIVAIFYLMSFIFSLFTLAMYFFDRIWVFSLLLLFMVVILSLFFIFMNSRDRTKPVGRQKVRKG